MHISCTAVLQNLTISSYQTMASLPRMRTGIAHNSSMTCVCILGNDGPQFGNACTVCKATVYSKGYIHDQNTFSDQFKISHVRSTTNISPYSLTAPMAQFTYYLYILSSPLHFALCSPCSLPHHCCSRK